MYTDWYPDGLTPEVIDSLISECLPDAAPCPVPGRRERREACRVLSSVVRTLPLSGDATPPAARPGWGGEAA